MQIPPEAELVERVRKGVGWPCFVKPNRNSGSFGITKVQSRYSTPNTRIAVLVPGSAVLIPGSTVQVPRSTVQIPISVVQIPSKAVQILRVAVQIPRSVIKLLGGQTSF